MLLFKFFFDGTTDHKHICHNASAFCKAIRAAAVPFLILRFILFTAIIISLSIFIDSTFKINQNPFLNLHFKMDIWRSNKKLPVYRINPIQFHSAQSSMDKQDMIAKDPAKWRPDIGETVHEDTTPKDYYPNHSLVKHFCAGAIAGFCSRTATAPLDRLKVFIQVNKSYNILTAGKFLYREGGFMAFWRGNSINIFKIAPESAFKFMAYEEIKRLMIKRQNHTDLNIVDRFLAGAFAGAFAQAMIYPLEVLKTRMALRNSHEGLCYITKNMWRHGRILSFYKGFIPNFLGIFPYAGIDLAVYETIKNLWIKGHPDTDPGVWRVIICGMVSSTFGQIVTYPLALVRTRLQALTVMNDPNQSTRMSGQFKYIWNTAGIKGLYRGFIPNFLKVMPAVGISYVTYEKCRILFGANMS